MGIGMAGERVTREQWEIVRRGGVRIEVLRRGDIRVVGRTYPVRQLLKALGYRWDGVNWVKSVGAGETEAVNDGKQLAAHGVSVLVVKRHGYPEDSEVLFYEE